MFRRGASERNLKYIVIIGKNKGVDDVTNSLKKEILTGMNIAIEIQV